MKKILSFLVVFTFLTTLSFTGCNKADKSEESLYDNQADTDLTSSGYNQLEATADNSEDSYAYNNSDATDSEKEYTDDGAEDIITEEKPSFSSQFSGVKIGNANMGVEKNAAFNGEQPYIPNSEEYSEIEERNFQDVIRSPLSTFSIDVDTASYANLRRNINYGIIPEADMVRIEEMLNYFSYDYEEPSKDKPFSINTEIGPCPWDTNHYLLMVGLQGKNVDLDSLPKSNLVFLIDVSGSMDEPDKLPLLKNAFSQLVEELGENDRVSIVVYAGSSGVVLDSARGDEKDIILNSLKSLSAGGSTAGAEGIELAYQLADKNFIKGGNNRVILATDGDFNVGPSSMEALEEIITEKKESGIFLSVLGFGMGNIKDNRMELLADKGNGNYSYIDSPKEAKKVLVDEMAGTLLVIAKDVKIQLEFNPYSVESYRLIGYENRALANEDFSNDAVDAGELGAGHSVTAIYEVIPGKASGKESDGDNLKYQHQDTNINKEYKHEITEIRLRYKKPDSKKSDEIRQVVTYANTPVIKLKQSDDFYFIAAIAEFGMILRNSEYRGDATIESVLQLAETGLGDNEVDYRAEFIDLVEQYQNMMELDYR